MLTSRFLLVNTFVTFPVTENLIFVLFWTNPSGVGLKAPAEADGTKNFDMIVMLLMAQDRD